MKVLGTRKKQEADRAMKQAATTRPGRNGLFLGRGNRVVRR